jgi:sodium pump decarboxylase gamma subunit
MIADGFKLMVLGMATVFIFLSLMVLFMGIMAKALAPFAGMLEKAPEKPKGRSKAKSGGAGENDKKLAAAAIAAVHMHRNNKSK